MQLTYKLFLKKIEQDYKPFPYEIDSDNSLYEVNALQNWATRQSKRFYECLKTCDPYITENITVMDIGAFPGTLLKLIRLFYGNGSNLVAVGMGNNTSFPADIHENVNASFVECDLDSALESKYPSKINYPDNSVDILICTEMIEHMYGVKNLMSEIHRVLKPSGVAYIGTNNISYLPGIFKLFFGNTNLDDNQNLTSALCETEWRGHVRFYALKQLKEFATLFDFEVVDSGYNQMRVPQYIVSKSGMFRWYLSRVLDAILFFMPIYRSHIFVLLKKSS